MKPSVGAIHELPLPMVLAIAHLLNHTWIQQRQKVLYWGKPQDRTFR